ncbi:sialate O-acetylesterase [Tolumonas lignilytica]|uniref:sialate O-acetylesterase n=1 Tax=Tolumonas lignilytica TaxID=1283284 RepID=UPI00046706AD|nr:sialate O-acetylesterase [Tolumonas lignilytica]
MSSGVKLLLVLSLLICGCDSSNNDVLSSGETKTLHSMVDVPILCNGKPLNKAVVIFSFGQSIASNFNEFKYPSNNHIFTIKNGECVVAQDPLPIADGINGSMWMPLGRKIIENGLSKNVLLISIGVGGSSIDRWKSGGNLSQHLKNNLEFINRLKIPVSLFLWHQGSSDIGTSGDNYINKFMDITKLIRSLGFNAPILVAIHSQCFNIYDKNIENAQRMLGIFHDRGLYEGANTNILDSSFRFDNCHLNKMGQEKAADLWLNAIKNQDKLLSWLSLNLK